jgi:hypothetical protein
MRTVRIKGRLRTWLLAGLAAFPLACGGSGGSGATNQADGGGSGDGGVGPGADGGMDGSSPNDGGSDGPALGNEPAYLRNDAIAGFSFTSNFGSPYDSIVAAPLDTTQSAIASGFTMQPAAGQLVATQKFQLVASSSDLYDALSISASLSVSSGLASVNAKTMFAQSTQIDSTDLWVVADLLQTGTSQKIENPTLTPGAAALSPEQFFALYGDRYAAEIVTGAEMFCTVQIHTYSQEDKSSLTASLQFAYGASSVSADFTHDVMSATANHSTNVNCNYLGFAPTKLVTDLPSLLDAAAAFQTGQAATLGDVTTSTLYLLYTSYYGIPGYPGIPAGVEARVAQQAQVASDFLLYDSLVRNDFSAYYADPKYSSLPFFTDMKTYRDGLSSFLSASITNSLNPGVTVPSPKADGVITDWTIAPPSLTSPAGNPAQFTVYPGIGNGIVPKKLSDYTIPLRYAYPDASGNGILKGTTFAPITPLPTTTTSATGPQPLVNYQLYLVDKGTTGLVLDYQWDAGTYFFAGVTDTTGAPSASLITSAITNFGLLGNLESGYVVASKANGFVMTDNGSSAAVSATHYTGALGQLWKFYMDAGSYLTNCATYAPPPTPDTPGVGCASGNNGIYSAPNHPPCGSLIYAISENALPNSNATPPYAGYSGYWEAGGGGAPGSALYANGGGGCDYCNWLCGSVHCTNSGCGGGPVPWDDFFLQSYDHGASQAIYNYAASPGGIVSYVIEGQAAGAQTDTQPVVVEPSISGFANELWVFIPYANIDLTP